MDKRIFAPIKRSSTALLMVAMAVLVAGVSNASTLILQPADGKDAEIDNTNPNTNLGTAGDLIINWFDNGRSIGLIEFDLSSLPANAQVTSATLSLDQAFNGCLGCRYDAFRITSPWNEGTVTFNTAPTIDPIAVASLVIADNNTSLFRDWNVTGVVAGWASGSFANYGLWIEEIPVQGAAVAYFESSDAGGAATDPRLSIDFSVPEPATLALLGLGLAGLGFSRHKK